MSGKIAEANQKEGRTLAEACEELRRICEEEDYILEIPPRQERHNPFCDALGEMRFFGSDRKEALNDCREAAPEH
jgi:hypothetical protein